LCVAKTASIGSITLMAVKETRVPSRGMQQMGVPMERGDNDEADRCRCAERVHRWC